MTGANALNQRTCAPLNGCPMTELGIPPEEWKVVRLGDAAAFERGISWSKKEESAKGTGVLSIPNIGPNGVLHPLPRTFISKPVPENKLLRKGDALLVASSGSIHHLGRLGVLQEAPPSQTTFASFTVRVRANPETILQAFLPYLLMGPLVDFSLFAKRAADGKYNLQLHRLRDFSVFVPPLPEQRAISHVLRTVQQAKEATERVIAALKDLKKSLMRYLFTYGPVPMDAADRVPLQETDIGPIPAHWHVVRLGEVVTKTQQIDPRKTPTQEFKYIDVSCVSNERLAIIGYEPITGKTAPSRARKLVKTGDVIFATVRPYLNRVVQIPQEFDSQICSTAFCVLRSRDGIIDNKFLFYAVSGDLFVKRVSGHQRGSNYPAVTDKDVLSETIPLPPLTEQREIAHILQAVDRKIGVEEARRQAMDNLLRSLLHHLMTARLSLPADFIARFAEYTP